MEIDCNFLRTDHAYEFARVFEDGGLLLRLPARLALFIRECMNSGVEHGWGTR